MNYSSLCIVLKGDIQEIKWEVLSTTLSLHVKAFLASCSASWAFQPTSIIQGGGHGCYEQSFWWNPICFYFYFLSFWISAYSADHFWCVIYFWHIHIYIYNGMMIKVWGFQTLGIWPKSLGLSGSVKFWRECLSSNIWVPTLRIKPVFYSDKKSTDAECKIHHCTNWHKTWK